MDDYNDEGRLRMDDYNDKEQRMLERIEAMRDAGRVKRLHTVPTIAHHTIADHVYGALSIAVELVAQNHTVAAQKQLSLSLERVMRVLLVHDAPELHTGDMPAPTKRALTTGGHDELNLMEDDFFGCYRIYKPQLNEVETDIVKASDTLDLGWHCVYERTLGNRHMRLGTVMNNILKYVEAQTYLIGVPEMKQYILNAWNRLS